MRCPLPEIQFKLEGLHVCHLEADVGRRAPKWDVEIVELLEFCPREARLRVVFFPLPEREKYIRPSETRKTELFSKCVLFFEFRPRETHFRVVFSSLPEREKYIRPSKTRETRGFPKTP